MEGIKVDWRGVVRRVKLTLLAIFSPHRSLGKLQNDDIHIMQELLYPMALVKNRKLKVVTWCKSNRGSYKLNVDDNSLDNPGFVGGGGVARDYKGWVIMGFASHYG